MHLEEVGFDFEEFEDVDAFNLFEAMRADIEGLVELRRRR